MFSGYTESELFWLDLEFRTNQAILDFYAGEKHLSSANLLNKETLIKRQADILQLKIRLQNAAPLDLQHRLQNIADELDKIENELKELLLNEEDLNESPFNEETDIEEVLIESQVGGETLRRVYLTNRREHLKKLRLNLTSLQTQIYGEDSQEPPSRIRRFFTGFLNIFNVAKKPIDLTDDMWYPIQNAITNSFTVVFGRYLIGGISLIIQPVEALTSLMKAKHGYEKEGLDTQRRAVKITTGLASFGLGATGTALAILIIIIATGIVFPGSAILPSIPPMILMGIYTLRLIDKIDSYRFRKKLLATATQEYAFLKSVTEIVQKKKKGLNLSIEESDRYARYAEIAKKHGLNPDSVRDHQILLERAQLAYLHANDKVVNARRKIAFCSIEVLATALVVVGTILGATAILGATGVATFGVAPTVIISVGVGIGFGLKIYQMLDKKYNLTEKIERKCRDLFTKLYNKLFSPSASEEPKPRPQPTPMLSLWARMTKSLAQTSTATDKVIATTSATFTSIDPVIGAALLPGASPTLFAQPHAVPRQQPQQDAPVLRRKQK